jgi:hypothetical protein
MNSTKFIQKVVRIFALAQQTFVLELEWIFIVKNNVQFFLSTIIKSLLFCFVFFILKLKFP